MPDSRLNQGALANLRRMITVTGRAWVDAGLVTKNSYGVVVTVARAPGANFEGASEHEFPEDVEGSPLPAAWFVENARGKSRICESTGLDSHVAIRLHPGSVIGLRGAFPWGGAVIDTAHGLIVGTSGLHEDEDILFSLLVRDYLTMLLDREGTDTLMAARERERGEDAATARFT